MPRVTFVPEGLVAEVPDGATILDAAKKCGAPEGDACGGKCACSTCHVIVHEGLESCNEATEAELDELDMAPGITPKSRLGCQCVPDGSVDIVVEIAEWNKNYAKEADH